MADESVVIVSEVISAPVEVVWRILSDTGRYAEWVEQTLEVTSSDGEAVVGAVYEERNHLFGPLKGTSKWTVVEVDPQRRQLHRGEGLPLVKAITIEFALDEQGACTEVTTTLRYRPSLGPLGRLIDGAKGRADTEKAQRKSLQNLAGIAEREAATQGAPA